jgi:hypothetical protein
MGSVSADRIARNINHSPKDVGNSDEASVQVPLVAFQSRAQRLSKLKRQSNRATEYSLGKIWTSSMLARLERQRSDLVRGKQHLTDTRRKHSFFTVI